MQYRNPFSGHVRRSKNRARSAWAEPRTTAPAAVLGILVPYTITHGPITTSGDARLTLDRPRMAGPVADLIHGRQNWRGEGPNAYGKGGAR